MDVDIPFNYPFKPPKVIFKTKIFHCNINKKGVVCLDLLTGRMWNPTFTLSKILLCVVDLMRNPNPESPYEPSIATLLKKSKKLHDDKAREWTKMYACA